MLTEGILLDAPSLTVMEDQGVVFRGVMPNVGDRLHYEAYSSSGGQRYKMTWPGVVGHPKLKRDARQAMVSKCSMVTIINRHQAIFAV